eukprot:59451-Amphidinium_carterae.3
MAVNSFQGSGWQKVVVAVMLLEAQIITMAWFVELVVGWHDRVHKGVLLLLPMLQEVIDM